MQVHFFLLNNDCQYFQVENPTFARSDKNKKVAGLKPKDNASFVKKIQFSMK